MYKYKVREGSLADFIRWFIPGLPVGALLMVIF